MESEIYVRSKFLCGFFFSTVDLQEINLQIRSLESEVTLMVWPVTCWFSKPTWAININSVLGLCFLRTYGHLKGGR